MRVAYLANQYPKISHTFIRREINGLENQGIDVERFALRRSADRLINQADQDEADKTTYVLDLGVLGLAQATLRCLLDRPWATLQTLLLAIRIGRRSDRGSLVNLIYFAEACALFGLLRRRSVQRIHAHFGTNATAVAMLCRALGGPPYGFTIHGPEEFDRPDLLHLRPKIAAADAIFAVSSFGRSQVFRHCDHTHWPKVHVIPCGVDASFLEATSASVPSAPRLVSVGRLCEQKGQLLLIEALGQLHREGQDFHLVLIGDGELRGAVEQAIVRHDLHGKVEITGWADEATVRRQVQAARALVLPSFAEGLPVVLMEALALGRPVVSTYIAGIPELVQHGESGWLVPAGSVEALVQALRAALTATPERLAEMGAAGRAQVLQRHDANKIGAQIAILMRRLATEATEAV
jgi:colanic acid/amylovoran biosynthesis glycosyltransferase